VVSIVGVGGRVTVVGVLVSSCMSSWRCSKVLRRLGMCWSTLLVLLVSGFMACDCD